MRTVANCERLRTVADGCGRLRTVADGCEHRSNGSRTRLYPQTPRVKREPFATHSGKTHQKSQNSNDPRRRRRLPPRVFSRTWSSSPSDPWPRSKCRSRRAWRKGRAVPRGVEKRTFRIRGMLGRLLFGHWLLETIGVGFQRPSARKNIRI